MFQRSIKVILAVVGAGRYYGNNISLFLHSRRANMMNKLERV